MSVKYNMIALFSLGLLLSAALGNATIRKDSPARHRRSLLNLSTMVTDVTGKDSTDFISYGNWCGLGGSGKPVDPVDECCQVHDLCYNLAASGPCRSKGQKGAYQVKYKWSKTQDGDAACDDGQEECETTACLCDAILTNCLKDNLHFFNNKNKHKLSLYEMLQEANYLSSR